MLIEIKDSTLNKMQRTIIKQRQC